MRLGRDVHAPGIATICAGYLEGSQKCDRQLNDWRIHRTNTTLATAQQEHQSLKQHDELRGRIMSSPR
jgi:hypothetical protein